MKKNLRKLLSLLTALTILFTMAGIPAMAEGEEAASVTVDFASAENLAYGKTVRNTYISYGHYNVWYSGTTPAVCSDGSITTAASANGSASGNKTRFTLDLGDVYKISEISLYQGTQARGVNIYTSTESPFAQNKDDEAFAAMVTQVGDGTIAAVATTVNGTDCSVNTVSALDVTARYITFEYPSKYAFTPAEIYVKGATATTPEPEPDPEPEVPAVPTMTVDFSETANIAYGKIITPISGSYYSSGPKPSATNQRATDGDITTYHSGYGKENGTVTGLSFSIDFGEVYKVSQIDLYLANIGEANRAYKLYKGTAVDEANLIATVPASNATAVVNGTEVAANSYELTEAVETQYLTFYYTEGYGFSCSELYIKGTKATAPTPDYAALVAADKAALDLGNTSAVEANLTLPTVGSVNGSTITWATSDAAVITNTGVITRAAEDKTATLTATITNGTASDTKTFTVTVAKVASEPEPELPASVTVDFTEATNVAYGKVVTPKAGKDKYAAGTAPSATNQKATDGDIATYHLAAGRSGISWGTQVGSEFSIDLGGNKAITSVDLYVQPAINDGSMDRTTDGYAINVYGGNDAATGTLIGQMTIPTATTAVTAGGKTIDMYIYHIDFPADAEYSAITFDKPTGWYFGYNEIYVNGTASATPDPDPTPDPEEPTPATKTVDFTAATNVAYQKVITPKAGRDYYANSSTKPSATSQLATDGDISTWHMAAGRTKLSWGDTVGCEFSMNLGGNKKITSIDLYVQVEGIYNEPGNTGNLRTFANETINIYGGADAATGTLIGTMTKPADADDYKIITANGKTMNMYVYHIDFPADAEYSTITFENGTKYNWAYNEIYVNGTEGTTGGGGTTEPEEPEVPAVPTETVNFAEAANVAYGKIITPIAGAYYSSGPKPSATNQKATDGDINTLHSGYGRATTSSSSEKTGVVFSMDLGKEYNLEDVVIYVSQTQRYCKVYSGTAVDENNLLLTANCDNVATTVNGKENMYKLTGTFPADTKAQYLTFNYPEGSGFPYYEIYVKGTEVTGGGSTEPEEPEIPGIPDGTIDFTAAKNIAYGKTLTHINGHYYSSGLAPAATRQFATDGNMNTWHAGYGKVNNQTVGVSFYIDLGKEYELGEVALFVNPAGRGYKVYKGTSVDEANYLADGIPTGELKTVNDGATQVDKVTATFPEGTKARYLTFYYSSGYGFSYYEMYMTGTEVIAPAPDYASLVAADKAALDIGNTSAVETNLTLPTVGANGSTITWETSDATVVTNTGVITRGAENKTATLTATITNGTATDTKTFTVTVAKKEITTVNFKAAKNLAYGKTITPKAGKDYYAASSTKPSATNQFATDGDITTWHMAAGRKNISWGTTVGSEFNVDLEKSRVIKSVYLYVQEGIHDSYNSVTGEYTGNYRTQGSLNINVYGGEDVQTGTLIGQMTKPTGLKTITADGKTMDMYIYRIDFPAGAEYSKITFDSTAWYFGYNEIYVEYELTDEDYAAVVASDKEALDLGNTSNVISDLTLPLVGENGSTITWATSDASVITDAGVVTRAADDKTATLTATITNGTATVTKTFEIKVLGTDSADGRVASDKAALDLGDTSAVTADLTLSTVGANGSTITWRTSNPAVVEADGTVHRDIDSNRATLTATITYGDAFDTKQFAITVLGTETDEERVASDKETLSLGDTTAVKGSLTLPTVGAKGTTITWATSDATVITKTGVITRGDEDKTATLTATIKYGNVTATKTFTVTVLKKVVVEGTVDFSASENVAYNKVATLVSGRDKYPSNHAAPDELTKYTTDGDLTTYHMAASRSGVSWGTTVGSEFTIDLTETFTLESADLFVQPTMFDGSMDRGNTNLKIYVFGDGNKDTGKLVGQMIIPAATTLISDGRNEMDVYIYHIDFPVNSHYSTLSFYMDNSYYWGWNEVYVKGQTSDIANVGDDKKALEFGDLNDVTENLVLPLVGAKKGSTITWTTTDASVIEADGTVHRAQHTKKAKLTATITKGTATETKEFLVTVLGTYDNHFVINSDAFNEVDGIKHKYVITNTENSTVAVNAENNKLELTRTEGGELSVKKYFVTERSDMPYSVIGGKVVLEQLMAISDGLQGTTAEICNKNGDVIAKYGIKKEGSDYVFFVNVSGREQTILYTYGDEIFTRVELITENGASKVAAFVGTEYGVNSVAELPLAASVHPSVTTVKYAANEGGNGKLVLDGVKFMIEGTNTDEIAVTIETENFKETHITTQSFDAITENLSLKTDSIFGCKYSYESSNPEIISKEGFVTRPLEDTTVTLTVTIKSGEFFKTLDFELTVKGLASDNMAMDNLILSSGAIEGSNDKNAVDGLMDTAFITDANEKFFAICFDKATTFNIVTLFEAKNEANEYGVTGFEIQVSDNGIEWETVYTGTTVGEQKTVEFPQVTTKYVRYYVTGLEGTQTGLHEIVLTYDPVPEVAIELDLAGIVITPNNYVVTGNLTLPTVGEYGSVITWKSSHPDILADDGTLVSVPEKDTVVKLTATLTNGEFTKTKDFTRSVKGSSNGETEEETGKTEKPGGVSGGGGGGGGGSDEKEDEPTVEPTPVDPTPVTPASVFKDVASDRWSYEYILELKEAGIVSGDGENFRPTDKVTREEFVKMLVLSLGITPEGEADFGDVASDAWYHDFIAAAVDKGIVNGISDSEFGIGRSISRQDMAVMTVRALASLDVELQGGDAPTFADGDKIADYATEAVETLAAAGILAGSDGMFAPADNLTREQAAKVLCMIRKELTK